MNESDRSEEDWYCFIPENLYAWKSLAVKSILSSANFWFAMQKITLEGVDFQNAISISHQFDEK